MKLRFHAGENSRDHGVTTQAAGPRNAACVDSRYGGEANGTGIGIEAKPAVLETPDKTMSKHGAMTPASQN